MPCAAAPCHGVNGMAPPDRPLELPPNDDQQLYANLTAYVSKACKDMKLVTPGNPAQSALVTILEGPCGATPRMPFGCSAEAGDCIPDEYIAAAAKSYDASQLREFERAVRSVYRQMVRISIEPRWAQFFDFGAGRVPAFLTKLGSDGESGSAN